MATFSYTVDPSSWQEVARRRQHEINSAIPEVYHVPAALLSGRKLIDLPESSGILNDRELKITSMTAAGLLKQIHNETYTSVEVATAFCKRASIVHQAVSQISSICLYFTLRV